MRCLFPAPTLEQFWQINRDGVPVAYFYLDPYSRPHEKRQVRHPAAASRHVFMNVDPRCRALGWTLLSAAAACARLLDQAL